MHFLAQAPPRQRVPLCARAQSAAFPATSAAAMAPKKKQRRRSAPSHVQRLAFDAEKSREARRARSRSASPGRAKAEAGPGKKSILKPQLQAKDGTKAKSMPKPRCRASSSRASGAEEDVKEEEDEEEEEEEGAQPYVRERHTFPIGLVNLGGRRIWDAAQEILQNILDHPTFATILLEVTDNLIEAIDECGKIVRSDVVHGVCVIAQLPLAREVNFIEQVVLETGARTKALSKAVVVEIVWDKWMVMGEETFRICGGHIHNDHAKKQSTLDSLMGDVADMITGYGPRILAFDANIALFKITDLLRNKKIQCDLVASHVEYGKTFCPAPVGHAHSLTIQLIKRPLFDSMGFFAVGRNSGVKQCGVDRHAFSGALYVI